MSGTQSDCARTTVVVSFISMFLGKPPPLSSYVHLSKFPGENPDSGIMYVCQIRGVPCMSRQSFGAGEVSLFREQRLTPGHSFRSSELAVVHTVDGEMPPRRHASAGSQNYAWTFPYHAFMYRMAGPPQEITSTGLFLEGRRFEPGQSLLRDVVPRALKLYSGTISLSPTCRIRRSQVNITRKRLFRFHLERLAWFPHDS